MGGKSHSSNDQMMQFEMQQAAEAKQKEADRQARLQQGTQQVNDIFSAGNFDDAFFNKYKQASLDYTLPQLQNQYTLAKNKLTYDTARAGTLNSSAAVDAAGRLNTQNLTDQAGLKAAADAQAASLRTQIGNEKQQAINQLYATEDPTVAANTATGMVQQGAISTPNLNPLGAMFDPIAVGGISAANSYANNYYTSQGLNPASPTGTGNINIVRST
jgi:hypothetical protein